ncbi:uncharacterized protein LOC143981629 [Lithobates pipiens]
MCSLRVLLVCPLRVLLLWALLCPGTGGAQKTFIVVFMENHRPETASTFRLHLVAYNEAAKVNVTIENSKFHQTVYVGSNNSAMLSLDNQYITTGNGLATGKVVTIKSDVDISVIGFNFANATADASFILPVEDLGTEYFIFTPESGLKKQFAVATGVNRIEWVNVTVSGSLTYNGRSYSTGDTFSFSLAPHQVIQFQNSTDLTGTRIVTSAPVAVFTGHVCYNAPGTTCDVLFQQLYPVRDWGKSFIVVPLANHTKDIIDIMAAYADTTVKADQKEYTLQPGSHIKLTVDKSIFLKSSKPVWVSYLSQDKNDPFLTTVLPLQIASQHYKFVTDSFFDNYITIVSQASSPAEFFLDQKPLSQYSVFTKEMNGFRSWEVSLGKVHGVHEIFHKSLPFSVYVYGFEASVSYGYTTSGLQPKNPAPLSDITVTSSCLPDGSAEAECSVNGSDPRYSWSLDGRSIFSDSLVTLPPPVSGILHCDVTNHINNLSRSINISCAVPLSDITVTSSCLPDGSAEAKCSVNGSDPRYSWSLNGRSVSSHRRVTLPPPVSGTLRCDVTNHINNLSRSINISCAVPVSDPVLDVRCLQNDSAEISCWVENGTDPSIYLTVSGGLEVYNVTSSEQTVRVTVPPVSPPDSWNIRCSAKNNISEKSTNQTQDACPDDYVCDCS